jgi:hypothetical protein
MTTSIDLKPLSEEVIKEMGYDEGNLWLVKIGSVVYGPYETQTLKHYVKDNEHLFENAEASLANETQWKSFWGHTKFERRKNNTTLKINSEEYDGPFWIIDHGLKTGPFTFIEIDKKIEMGLLGVTDRISIDHGSTWIKVYQISGFDRRARLPEELPAVPYESSFDEAEEILKNKQKSPQKTTIAELADMTWQGIKEEKTSTYNLAEINWKNEHSKFGSFMKWAVPSLVLVSIGFCLTSILLFYSFPGPADVADNLPEVQESTSTNTTGLGKRLPSSMPHERFNKESSSETIPTSARIPAEAHPNHQRRLDPMHEQNSSATMKQRREHHRNNLSSSKPQLPPTPSSSSRYPTQVITHNNENEASPDNNMSDPPEAPEPSLVNNEEPPESPPDSDVSPSPPEIMEETSDF